MMTEEKESKGWLTAAAAAVMILSITALTAVAMENEGLKKTIQAQAVSHSVEVENMRKQLQAEIEKLHSEYGRQLAEYSGRVNAARVEAEELRKMIEELRLEIQFLNSKAATQEKVIGDLQEELNRKLLEIQRLNQELTYLRKNCGKP